MQQALRHGAAALVVIELLVYPGWTATIDAAATPIYPIDLPFRGVFVSAGTHRIVFDYEQSGLRLGPTLAALGLLLIGVLRRYGPGARSAV